MKPIATDIVKGNKYEVFNVVTIETETTFSIVDEIGDKIFCRLNGCAHISFNNWKIKNK